MKKIVLLSSPLLSSQWIPSQSGNAKAVTRARRGFSLVLALVIMTMLLSLVVILAAFLSHELRLTQASALTRQARLMAYAGARIAFAHIQQEAGADQRVTAQANVTLPDNSRNQALDELRKLWKDRNPYWTGVWDTRDESQERPPSWLVSGEIQLHTLAKANSYERVGSGYWVPWENTRLNDHTDPDTVILFSQVPEEHLVPKDLVPFETRVTVRRVPVYATEPGTDDAKILSGHYAYWVTDEGVKARLNMHDPATGKTSEINAFRWASLRAPSGSSPVSYPGWNSIPPDSESAHGNVVNVSGFANIKGISSLSTQTLPNITPSYAHAVTAYSHGIMTDTRHGGLKRDLSIAFEMPATDFRKFIAGKDADAAIVLNMQGDKLSGGPDSLSKWKWDTETLLTTRGPGAARTYKEYYTKPIFNIKFAPGNIRGPAWEMLHNYYNLYKPADDDDIYSPNNTPGVDFSQNYANNAFRARTFYPGMNQTKENEAISHRFNSRNAGANNTIRAVRNPFAEDRWGDGNALQRPLKIAATAYTTRYMIVFGLQRKGDTVRLIFNVIIGIHNPFNIPIRLHGNEVTDGLGRTGIAGMKLGLREFASTYFTIYRNDELVLNKKRMTDLFKNQSDTYNGEETFCTYIPNVTIMPGETLLFSPTDQSNVPYNRQMLADENFNQLGGFSCDRIKDTGTPDVLTVKDDDKIKFILSYSSADADGTTYQSGSFIREHVSSWPHDRMTTGYEDCAEHSEPFSIQIAPHLSGTLSPGEAIPVSIIPTQGSYPMGMVEFIEKPADWGPSYGGENNGGVPTGFPLYAMSNPLTSTKRPDAQGTWKQGTGIGIGYTMCSPSWHFRTRRISSHEEAVEGGHEGPKVFAGPSLRQGIGKTSFITAQIPRMPMRSLGDFQTACLSITDHQALYAVGHSFPMSWVAPDNVYRYDTESNWTNYDHTWLVNHALWDRFFFSTIAPDVQPSSNAAATVLRNQNVVWQDFLKTKDAKPLPNRQFIRNPNININDEKVREVHRDYKAGYRRSAAYLLQKGTININITDPRTWKAILGASRNSPVPYGENGNQKGFVENSSLTPFARILPSASATLAKDNFNDDASWKGVRALNDTQLEKLAQELVKKIRIRLASAAHKVKYTHPTAPANTLCRPFFSLAEFINRAAVDNTPTSKLGVVHSALLSSKVNSSFDANGYLERAMLTNSVLGKFPFPESAIVSENERLPLATGAAGMLLQGDILQNIGSRISARSDTFVIRTYGDVVNKTAPDRPSSRAWCEMVVQRTPEYMDPRNEPEDIAHDTKVSDSRMGKDLTPINKYFGRRFRIVSMRWLASSDI